jgi:hypothetical protein
MENKTLTALVPGQRGTTSGFPAVVVRHYDGNMYEVRVPGGLCCIDAADFIPAGCSGGAKGVR